MRFLALALVLAACSTSPPPADAAPDVAPDLCVCMDVQPPQDIQPTDAGPDAPADVAPEASADATDSSSADAPADAQPADGTPGCVDRDGDGYGAGCAMGPDCDDTDRERHPGAIERCNGLDDNCDGTGDTARSEALDNWCTELWGRAWRRTDPADELRAHCVVAGTPPRPGDSPYTSMTTTCRGCRAPATLGDGGFGQTCGCFEGTSEIRACGVR